MLILSIFPGIDLLGMAFELEWPEACIVRGPDLLWGGDIKRFHPPAGKFDGVIGGPPCNLWARTATFNPDKFENLIPEFERCVAEAAPHWFLMENVPRAPSPQVESFWNFDQMVLDGAVGGATSRERRFTLGVYSKRERPTVRFEVVLNALWPIGLERTVTSGGAQYKRDGTKYRNRKGKISCYGAKTRWSFDRGKRAQGLSEDFDLPPFTVRAKVEAIGNGVPLAMGRAVAKAVKKVLALA